MGKKVVDYDTGEIIENVVRVVTKPEQKKIDEYKELQQRRKQLRELISNQCGGFYFYRYDKIVELLSDDTATAFRFLYLCACADKDGYLIKYDHEYCTTIEDFTYIFDKGKDSVKKYMKNIVEANLIYKDGQRYKLNPMYYSMGGMDDDFKRQSIRTFNNAIKHLYYNSNPKEHSIMGQLIKLVPYINIYNNTLCTDIECVDKKQLIPLDKADIANILQPNNNYGYTLLDKLMHVLVKGEPVIGLFISMGQYQYRVNPRLFYRGNNPKDLQDLIDTFDIAKTQFTDKKRRKMANG